MHEIFDIKKLTSINSSQSLIDIGDHVWIARGAAIVCSSKKYPLVLGLLLE